MSSLRDSLLVIGLGIGCLAGVGCGNKNLPGAGGDGALTRIDRNFLLSSAEARDWHEAKDSLGGPTYSGSLSWLNFLEIVESRLVSYGAVDLVQNEWTYERWLTTEWPDTSSWSLVSNGQPVQVASYGAYSGSTAEEGVIAPLVLWDADSPPSSLEGRIVVFEMRREDPFNPPESSVYVHPGDYEYLSDPDTFEDTRQPRLASNRISPFPELRQVRAAIETVRGSGAAGAVFVMDASYGLVSGLYTFAVPALYDVPSLYLDRVAGRQVIDDSRAEREATLRLVAETEEVSTYQLIAYLPGRHYGTPEDEQILLTTHTDGPSISQDNGAFGILGIVHYVSHVPQSERPRTLLVFLDNRHYMPGMERVFAEQNWFGRHPEAWEKIVSVVGIEHLGQLEYEEQGEELVKTGLVEQSRLHSTHNSRMVEMAIRAVRENGLRRVAVHCVDRPGIHGTAQGRWFGLGGVARRRGLPGFATMGSMAAYWSTKARIDTFDAQHFVDQVATMAQLTGELMTANLEDIATVPVESGAAADAD